VDIAIAAYSSPASRASVASGAIDMLTKSAFHWRNRLLSALVLNLGPSIVITVPLVWWGIFCSSQASISFCRKKLENGSAMLTCIGSCSNFSWKVISLCLVKSMNWSKIMKSPLLISFFSEPTAVVASTCVHPSCFKAWMFAL